MKNFILSFTYVVIFFLCLGCSNGSSGTAMLDLGEIRVVPNPKQVENKYTGQLVKELATVFTVAPGPYEFVWEELKNQDGATGYESCSTKLKMKLILNKKIQYTPDKRDKEGADFLSGKEVVPNSFKDTYSFKFRDAEGKTQMDHIADHSDGSLILSGDVRNTWGVNGRIDYKENTDRLLEFYRFLTGESGNEYELVIDCGIQQCSKIKEMLEVNKSLIIYANDPPGYAYNYKVVDL